MNCPDITSPPLFRAELCAPAYPLFDVHANLGMSDFAGIGFGRLSASEYQRLMVEANVRWACVFPPLLSDYASANVALRDWCKSCARGLLPFARLGGIAGPRPITRFWQARRTVRAAVGKRREEVPDLSGYAGIKLIPHMSGMPGPATLAAISHAQLPVLIHAGAHSPPRWIEKTLIKRHAGPVILAHLGAYPTEPTLLADAVSIAQRYEQVYLDTSGAWLSEFIRYAAQRVPHKLLFGSDAPLAHPRVAWLQLQSTISDDTVLEGIAWRQAFELFQLGDAP